MNPTIVCRFTFGLLAALFGSILSGCGSSEPTLLFTPPGASGVTLHISLEKNESARTIALKIDGEKLCSESIDSFNAGEQMKCNYRGHLVTAQIHTITSYVTDQEITSCNITYDGESIGEIELRKTKLP